jgi:1,2-diacylglycerol 3-beta-glucosyltransferase
MARPTRLPEPRPTLGPTSWPAARARPTPRRATSTATDPAETPDAWRVAALALLAGGIGAGFGLSRLISVRGGVVLAAAGSVALALPIVVGERRWLDERRRAGDGHAEGATAAGDGALPFISVIVAARDEVRALPGLLDDLAVQDHCGPDGRPRWDLTVIDDQSTDGTGDVARRAAGPATVVERRGCGLTDGKGAALMAVPPDEVRGDVVVVLDADARVDPRFLSTVAAEMDPTTAALVCPIALAGEGALAGAQVAEQRLDLAIQRARSALGGLAEMRGTAIVVRRSSLVGAGGWRPVLTEDLDLSSRLALQGDRVGVATRASVAAEAVPTLPALWRQRLRWAEGALRRTFEHGPSILASPTLPPRARLDFAIYAGQLSIPGVLLGAAAGAVGLRRPGAFVGLTCAFGLGLGLAGRDGRALPLVGLWLLAVPASAVRLATRRGPVRYAKMEHSGFQQVRGRPR